ncbi:hypothetical protein, partial [Streptococcus ferus]|uniref:hypothetical protein n=1 Tax=Streptococcus ferus TaxID=1345 RepID=UPI0035A07837
DPWSAALVLFGATWLVFPIFYSFYNVWDARVQNEIIFLKEIIRNRPATKPNIKPKKQPQPNCSKKDCLKIFHRLL